MALHQGEFASDVNFEERELLVEDNQDATQNILEELVARRSDQYEMFQGPMKRYVQLVLPDGTVQPRRRGVNQKGPSIRMAIFGTPVATKIVFDVVVREMKSSKNLFHPSNIIHSATLEFDLHERDNVGRREVSELTYQTVFTKDGTDDFKTSGYCDPCYVDVHLKTKGGVSCGLRYNDSRINTEARSILDQLYMYSAAYSKDERDLHVRIQIKPDEVLAAENLVDILEQYSQYLPARRAWFPYRARLGDIRCQSGQLVPRALVKQAWSGSIVPVPPTNYFHDLDEGSIKLVYGAQLDWRVGIMHFQRLLKKYSQVAFIIYGESSVYAVVRIEKTELNDALLPVAIRHTELMIADGSRVKIDFVPEGERKGVTCSGIVIPDYANTGTGDLHIAVYGKSLLRYGELVSKPGEPLHFVDAFLEFDEIEAPLRRQINALTRLRETPRWHHLFLNHESTQLPDVKPLDGLDPSNVETAFKTVLGLKHWNREQKAVLDLAKNLKSGFGLVEGFPGCGKSTTLAALAILYHVAGLHVLIVGPSNASVDAVTEKLIALSPDIDYVRVRQARLEGATPSARGEPDEETEQAAIDRDTVIATLLRDLKNAYHKRLAGDLRYTVFSHVEKRAVAAVGRNETLEVSRETIAEDGKTTIETFDAYSFVSKYLANPPQRPNPKGGAAATKELVKWKEDQKRLRKGYDAIADVVLMEARIVACTDNLAGSDLVRKNFAAHPDEKCQGIIVIGDEDGQALETNAWIPIVSLNQANLVKGVIRGGDRHQLPPLVTSAFGTQQYNEFAAQLGRSLFDRLLRTDFPVKTLSLQHRMAPILAKFPSSFTYEGKMKSDASVMNREMPPKLKDALITWLDDKPDAEDSAVKALTANDLRLIGINVEDGQTVTETRTMSRFNIANINVVIHLLSHMIDKGALGPKSDVAIITPYAEQRSRYVKALITLAADKQVRWTDMVKVATVDSMQGHESECIILDWVISSANTAREIGFTMDNNRCNVALTRAKQCLIVVGNGNVTTGEFQKKKRGNGEHDNEVEMISHWSYLFDSNAVYTFRGNCEEDELEEGEIVETESADPKTTMAEPDATTAFTGVPLFSGFLQNAEGGDW